MKIRTGFVSNSSSSSFIVKYKDFIIGEKGIKIFLTKIQEKKLQKYGFHKTSISLDKDWYHYGFQIICNQDDVIKFLIKNKISFKADIHYENHGYIYNAEKDELIIAVNYGKIYHLYGKEAATREKQAIRKISGVKYLKEIR